MNLYYTVDAVQLFIVLWPLFFPPLFMLCPLPETQPERNGFFFGHYCVSEREKSHTIIKDVYPKLSPCTAKLSPCTVITMYCQQPAVN